MNSVKIQVEESSSKNEDNVQCEHQNENPGGRNSGVFYFLFRRNYLLCWLSPSMYLSSNFPTRWLIMPDMIDTKNEDIRFKLSTPLSLPGLGTTALALYLLARASVNLERAMHLGQEQKKTTVFDMAQNPDSVKKPIFRLKKQKTSAILELLWCRMLGLVSRFLFYRPCVPPQGLFLCPKDDLEL